jgi:A/G-specific adenine glycosylase
MPHVGVLDSRGMTTIALLASLEPPDGTYPWQTGDPWIRLTSEVLLSRTRRSVVARVFPGFISRWPTPDSLAVAHSEEVWEMIRPTGLRRRADQLIAIANAIPNWGHVPSSRDELLSLPGVGDYGADAVRLLAFDGDRLPLDMNIDRVVTRLSGVPASIRGRSPYRNEALVQVSEELMAGSLEQRRAVFTGILELSASTCRPNPLCDVCPLSGTCEFALDARRLEMVGRDSGG